MMFSTKDVKIFKDPLSGSPRRFRFDFAGVLTGHYEHGNNFRVAALFHPDYVLAFEATAKL
jgi:hypothetical protein